jgi:hypothetical protein
MRESRLPQHDHFALASHYSILPTSNHTTPPCQNRSEKTEYRPASHDLAALTKHAEEGTIMVKRGLFSGLSRASLIALIGAGIVVTSVDSSFAGGNDRGQKNQRCRDLVGAKHLQGDQRRAEWQKCQSDSTNYK